MPISLKERGAGREGGRISCPQVLVTLSTACGLQRSGPAAADSRSHTGCLIGEHSERSSAVTDSASRHHGEEDEERLRLQKDLKEQLAAHHHRGGRGARSVLHPSPYCIEDCRQCTVYGGE